MKQELNVGDSFEVFRVITDGEYGAAFTPGTLRVGYYKPKTERFANILGNDGLFKFMIVPSEAIPVGRMVIKQLNHDA